MNQIEQALIDECAKKCAKEIQKTLKLFKDTKFSEKVLIRETLYNITIQFARELDNG